MENTDQLAPLRVMEPTLDGAISVLEIITFRGQFTSERIVDGGHFVEYPGVMKKAVNAQGEAFLVEGSQRFNRYVRRAPTGFEAHCSALALGNSRNRYVDFAGIEINRNLGMAHAHIRAEEPASVLLASPLQVPLPAGLVGLRPPAMNAAFP